MSSSPSLFGLPSIPELLLALQPRKPPEGTTNPALTHAIGLSELPYLAVNSASDEELDQDPPPLDQRDQSLSQTELPMIDEAETAETDPNLPNVSPIFERCGEISNAEVFDITFDYMKSQILSYAKGTNDGRIYVLQCRDSPSHVKVGLTKKIIKQRVKQIERCVNEWFEADANDVADHVQRWRRWMSDDPYDEYGNLYDSWVQRIEYFTSDDRRYLGLLAESPYKAWSIFLEPP
ncbi:MAG: hypothetical protein Q9166_006165 [cf. Caloplaca sp. 2 TL-2023]